MAQQRTDDQGEISAAELEARAERERRASDLSFILETEQGRRFIRRLFARCGLFRTSFTGNSQTYFNEGERNIGLELLAEIEKTVPEALPTLLVELPR